MMFENPGIDAAECAKLVSKNWSQLDQTQKEPYIQQAAADRIRYDQEIAQFIQKGFFINQKGENSKNLYKPKITDDIVLPKKPRPAFTFYHVERSKKLKEANPSQRIRFITQQTGLEWKALTNMDKQRYQILCEQDKARYKKEMDQLMSQGFFINKDGVKSTDIEAKRKPAQSLSNPNSLAKNQINGKKSPVSQSQNPSNKTNNLTYADETSKSPLIQLTGSNPPRRFNTPYFIFFSKQQEMMKEKNLKRTAELAKYTGQAWNLLDKSQRLHYKKLAAADKIRYDKEMAQYNELGYFINEKGENSKTFYIPKLTYDIVQPKRALPAHIFYNSEQGKKLRAANPSLKVPETTKIIAKNWNALSEKDKKKYQHLADQDRQRYREEMNQLMTQGFFVNKDGVKSTDMRAKRMLRQNRVPVEIKEKIFTHKKSSQRVKQSD